MLQQRSAGCLASVGSVAERNHWHRWPQGSLVQPSGPCRHCCFLAQKFQELLACVVAGVFLFKLPTSLCAFQ
jgi:hypothetical protein